MNGPPSMVRSLLERSHSGNRAALEALVTDHYQTIYTMVKRRLGPGLRAKAETVDYVQDAIVKVLDYGPRVVISNEEHFRRLMSRIIENLLRDRNDYWSTLVRDRHRERPLPRDSVLDLDPSHETGERPSQILEEQEEREWLHLALLCLPPEHCELLWLRVWEELPFREVGERLGLEEDAARLRFNRHALPRLARTLTSLKEGRIEEVLREV